MGLDIYLVNYQTPPTDDQDDDIEKEYIELEEIQFLTQLKNNNIFAKNGEKNMSFEIEVNGKLVNVRSIEIGGIDLADYPDFCDAYIEYAEFENGIPLNEMELNNLEEDYPELVHELAHDCFID